MQLVDRIRAREAALFVVVATLVVTCSQVWFYKMPAPTLDALRYADYILNIHDHGIFGLSGSAREQAPEPGYANTPAYPAYVATALKFHPPSARNLRCVLRAPDSAQNCATNFTAIVVAQNVLVVIALFALWLSCRCLFAHRMIAWLASAFALATTKLQFFANTLLTEILILALYAVLLLCLTRILQTAQHRWWFALGLCLGLLALTRPEYLYVAFVLTALGAVSFCWKTARSNWRGYVLACVVFCTVIGPWLARNHHHFGQASLTGGYGDIIIAYRAAYNRMHANEWLAAFVYWLPAHGEVLASKLFAPEDYVKLGTDPGSYLYKEGTDIFDAGLLAVDNDRDRLMTYLIKTEILDQPLKHFTASIPLAWRGILAGKYLAVLGLPCLLIGLFYAVLRRHWIILVLLLPASILVALYAAVSVSIPRYNVYLIYYYATATAWALVTLYQRRNAKAWSR